MKPNNNQDYGLGMNGGGSSRVIISVEQRDTHEGFNGALVGNRAQVHPFENNNIVQSATASPTANRFQVIIEKLMALSQKKVMEHLERADLVGAKEVTNQATDFFYAYQELSQNLNAVVARIDANEQFRVSAQQPDQVQVQVGAGNGQNLNQNDNNENINYQIEPMEVDVDY